MTLYLKLHCQTRMHSSRMRTGRTLTVFRWRTLPPPPENLEEPPPENLEEPPQKNTPPENLEEPPPKKIPTPNPPPKIWRNPPPL